MMVGWLAPFTGQHGSSSRAQRSRTTNGNYMTHGLTSDWRIIWQRRTPITVGLFEDGQPGEIFLVMAKEGSTISGFAYAFAQAISYALQYGVPLQALVDKFSHVRFEPSGMTRNPEIRFAKSIVDYIFRWMASKFMSPEAQFHAGVNGRELDEHGHGHTLTPTASAAGPASASAAASEQAASAVRPTDANPHSTIQNQEDAPPCSTCGAIMIRSGACYKCSNCGNTSGCA